MSAPYRYSVFGLTVESAIQLPELYAGDASARPDVHIRAAAVDADPACLPGIHQRADGALLIVEEVGRYLVRAGREILVESDPGVPPENLRLFLLGSAFGLLLHQRGLLPLHANAVEIGGRAVAFTGASGAGKSTLAAWFHDRGFSVIADDVCVLRFDDGGGLLASPGIPRLRLWREVLEASGRDAAAFSRSYAGDESFDKFDVPIAAREAPGVGTPLGAICLLDWADEPQLGVVDGMAAAEVVMANTYRGWVLEDRGAIRMHWETAVRIARDVPIFRFARPRGNVEESGRWLRAWLEGD